MVLGDLLIFLKRHNLARATDTLHMNLVCVIRAKQLILSLVVSPAPMNLLGTVKPLEGEHGILRIIWVGLNLHDLPNKWLFVPEKTRMVSLTEYLCLSSTKAVNVRIATFLAFGMSGRNKKGIMRRK